MASRSKRGRASLDVDGGQSSRPPKSPRFGPSSSGYTNSQVPWDDLFEDEFEPNVTDLTQRDDGPVREFYGSFEAKIVGVRHYRGVATPGEVVICKREPFNQYDKNAIRVDNVFGIQIGHIPRTVAAKLAPYLDTDDISIEAVITGEKGQWDCPARINVYGTSAPNARAHLEERLKKDKILKATQLKETRGAAALQQARRQAELQQLSQASQSSQDDLLMLTDDQARAMGLKSGRSSAGIVHRKPEKPKPTQPEFTVQQLVQASQAVNLRATGTEFVKSLVKDEEQLSSMPMAQQPESLRATLLPYQLQGLAWLTAKENPEFPAPDSEDSTQLWKRDARGRYCNMATLFTVTSPPPRLLSGGILADDMGLGKTLQIISLIMTGGEGTTLIVAPVGVMSNWQQQIERHVHDEHLPKVLIYHGGSKQSSAKSLDSYGVVITSYGTLSSDKGPLQNTNWRRVVLDEGHTIRNAKTRAAEAACTLKAQSKWVLTGTPIINNIKDLHSLLNFLGITGGIEQPEVFNTVIARPLAWGDVGAEILLQSLMNDLCLRRKKDMKFVDLKLPPKTEYIHRITFWADEKKKYDALLLEAQGELEKFQHKKSSSPGRFQHVLERLLRLRQMCNHWTLCKKRITDLMAFLEDTSVVSLTAENRALLQQALQLVIESQEECAVCMELMTKPVITHCKHVFCLGCISKVIEIQQKCPMCRAPLSDDKLVEPAPEASSDEEEVDPEAKSSKTEALLKILQATMKNEGSKVIIFSQWTSFLNVIQQQLVEAGYKHTRIDGNMKFSQRDAAIQALDTDPETRIMLASLSVCSVGLNLVAADTVILADSWWAPAIEDQAVDRVHRLGQKRPTTVWRLVMEGTVEERVLDIQARKRELVTKAFQEKGKKKQVKETSMSDLRKLLS
ncbi:helicase-like protein [Apodospora peruviana]|uniref:Helicase-like protein n=1 Tax=Apodospora peruviana TaxID=516989 RepID=A0AAE0I4X8_9PEZI|nr:helicase-like protein [Apodospora peruviana]